MALELFLYSQRSLILRVDETSVGTLYVTEKHVRLALVLRFCCVR